jgi:hypothetical protein
MKPSYLCDQIYRSLTFGSRRTVSLRSFAIIGHHAIDEQRFAATGVVAASTANYAR